MKTLFLAIALISYGLSTSAQKMFLKSFDFVVGTWEMKTKSGKIIERWKKHKDSLTGQSHRFNVIGDSVLTEDLVLKKIKEDRVSLS